MKIMKITFVTVALMLASASMAEEEMKMKFQIEIDSDVDHGAIHLELDSDSMGFELHDMQVGEVQSVIDESGRSILITREADGFKIDVDGKTINLPLFDGKHGAMWFDGDHDVSFDVSMVHDRALMDHDGMDGVTVISSKEIDLVTQETIKSLLMSTGHDGNVNFIDGGSGGLHKTIVIRKEVIVAE